ncbi:MAG: hypothetical protein KGN02_02655 [bacterium]|nr:hypothetical protein [bacterium]
MKKHSIREWVLFSLTHDNAGAAFHFDQMLDISSLEQGRSLLRTAERVLEAAAAAIEEFRGSREKNELWPVVYLPLDDASTVVKPWEEDMLESLGELDESPSLSLVNSGQVLGRSWECYYIGLGDHYLKNPENALFYRSKRTEQSRREMWEFDTGLILYRKAMESLL